MTHRDRVFSADAQRRRCINYISRNALRRSRYLKVLARRASRRADRQIVSRIALEV